LPPAATVAAPGPVGGVGSNGTNGGCDDWFMGRRVQRSWGSREVYAANRSLPRGGRKRR
jgi:hypothetical protein